MHYLYILFLTAVAYLIGSLPISLIITKLRYGIDIREHGNGQASWGNVYETISPKIGFWALGLEIAKGAIAPALAIMACMDWGRLTLTQYPIFMLSFGLAAILGQNFPIFTKFKPNNDISCAIGVLLCIHPLSTLICTLIAIVVYLISKYVQWSYVIALIAFPILLFNLPHKHAFISPTLWLFVGVLALGIFYLHSNKMLYQVSNSRIHVLVRKMIDLSKK
ncbi:MAG: glycerol-3-phosphate acyltransferase [Bacteroidia bacterium]